MTQEEFSLHNQKLNQKLKEAYQKNPKFKYEPTLPKPEVIYDKDFHFLDETLNQKQEREKKKIQKKLRKQEQLEALAKKKQDELNEGIELNKQLKSDEKEKVLNEANNTINISN